MSNICRLITFELVDRSPFDYNIYVCDNYIIDCLNYITRLFFLYRAVGGIVADGSEDRF